MLLLKYQGICERMERERERKEGRRKGSRRLNGTEREWYLWYGLERDVAIISKVEEIWII